MSDLTGRTGVPSWLARRKQETALRKQEIARRKELWRGFAQQPGTHLRWELAGGLRHAELAIGVPLANGKHLYLDCPEGAE